MLKNVGMFSRNSFISEQGRNQQFYNEMTANRKTQYALPPLREKVDQYSFANKESIGKGFSSSVYRGRDDRTDEHVAIKVIDMKAMKGEIHKNLLQAEIQILNMIKDRPNLLDVQKIYTDKNKTYIITDYCDGGDLGKYIKAKKKLHESDAIRMIKQIIKGYESLYALGVVHRDLKPANIFFKNAHLEIGDFGFAVKQQKLKANEKYNVGSPVYMPPQALNSNKYSHKSDIWAIGVIFYEMLTGNTPWSGRTQTELKTKMKTISIRNILPPELSKAASSFLKKSLETDQKKRMEPYEMFDHFETSHEHEEDEVKDIYNDKNNRLFRSMRKSTRNQLFDTTRADSMKKTSNALMNKLGKAAGDFSQTGMNIQIAPKTALNIKPDKEYMSAIQKRMISKQLLSQVHLCRFIYKLLANIEAGNSFQVDLLLREQLTQFLFYKLRETKNLLLVSDESVEEYREFSDCKKLEKLVDQYLTKYKKKLKSTPALDEFTSENYSTLINVMVREIKNLYRVVSESRDPSFLVKEIIVLDYMVTTVQLLTILKGGDLAEFHFKSKIQAIVDGESITEVSGEHVHLIGNKLRVLGVL